jgi:SH3-like domain-containing protein
METKYGFTKLSISEFETWMANQRVGRTIIYLQHHHTYIPSYQNFTGANHFAMQVGMRNHHVVYNGWRDIGQHFSIFPDGTILTGRSLEFSPACIYGNNSNAICVENVGNFDAGNDQMTALQKDAIIRLTAAICKKFSIPVNIDKIVYHHWFNLSTGERNNGTALNKSCPGTSFFSGNKVTDCETHFIPLVQQAFSGVMNPGANPLKYTIVTAQSLNVRVGPDWRLKKASGREAVTIGSILRVFEEQNGWYRISSSHQHWVSGRFTDDVRRALVNASTLNVRSGPSTSFSKVSSFMRGQEVFIIESKNGWCRGSMDSKWVKDDFLNF